MDIYKNQTNSKTVYKSNIYSNYIKPKPQKKRYITLRALKYLLNINKTYKKTIQQIIIKYFQKENTIDMMYYIEKIKTPVNRANYA